MNFKKLRPRAPILKGSKVLEELQHIAIAEPVRVQELKRASTFLVKPQRPVPKPKNQQKPEEQGEVYKVVIKKQDKRTTIARLVEKGLLPPGSEIVETPQPVSEVKMRETESGLERDRPVASDSNPRCLISSLDTAATDVSPSHSSELDSGPGTRPAKLPRVRPSRRGCDNSTNGGTNRTGTRLYKRARARYAEKILLRNAREGADLFIGRRSPFPEIPRSPEERRVRTRGRYSVTRLWSGSVQALLGMTALFQLSQSRGVAGPNASSANARRSNFKGRYLERILRRNVASVLGRVKDICSRLIIGDQPGTKSAARPKRKFVGKRGHYAERCFYRQSVRLRSALLNLLDFLATSERGATTRYSERLARKKLGILEFFAEYVRFGLSSGWLGDAPSCASCEEYPLDVRSLESTSDDSVPCERRLEERDEHVNISERRGEDTSTCPLREESPVIIDIFDGSVPNEKEANESVLEDADDPVSCERVARTERPDSSGTADAILPEEADDCPPQSTEILHRDDKRLSSSRDSVDVVRSEDDALSKFLQSAESYVSAEVFHRGSRRLSRRLSRGNIERQQPDVLSSLLHTTTDYVSSEVFHRGSRRLSRSSKKEALCATSAWWGGSKGMCFNLPWFSIRMTSENEERGCGGKTDRSEVEYDNEGRRSSFVPTILYRGLANRIGVDFTRLMAYAFVPCSVVLLYMYK